MINIRKEVEIAVRVERDPSAVTRVISLVGGCGIHILACRQFCGSEANVVLLVTEDPRKTELVLDAAGFPCRRDTVVAVDGHDQFCAQIQERLRAAGIGVFHSYRTSLEEGRALAVVKTANDESAMEVLQANGSDAPVRLKEMLNTLFRLDRGTPAENAQFHTAGAERGL